MQRPTASRVCQTASGSPRPQCELRQCCRIGATLRGVERTDRVPANWRQRSIRRRHADASDGWRRHQRRTQLRSVTLRCRAHRCRGMHRSPAMDETRQRAGSVRWQCARHTATLPRARRPCMQTAPSQATRACTDVQGRSTGRQRGSWSCTAPEPPATDRLEDAALLQCGTESRGGRVHRLRSDACRRSVSDPERNDRARPDRQSIICLTSVVRSALEDAGGLLRAYVQTRESAPDPDRDSTRGRSDGPWRAFPCRASALRAKGTAAPTARRWSRSIAYRAA